LNDNNHEFEGLNDDNVLTDEILYKEVVSLDKNKKFKEK